MSVNYWPEHVHVTALPPGDDFWPHAWQELMRLHAQHPDLTVLSHAHWPLAELARQAVTAAQRNQRVQALPRVATLDEWLAAAVIRTGQPPASGLQRQLLVREALAQLPGSGLDAASEAARAALARRLTDLLDALDVAQFPYSNAVGALAKLSAQEPFAQRELAVARAVAQVLADVGGTVQQQLDALRALRTNTQTPLLLLTMDKRMAPWMRAIARAWQGPMYVVQPDYVARDAHAELSHDALVRLAARVSVIDTPHLEAHGQSAAGVVVDWLAQAPTARIHIAALDRRAARRTRALLERAGITVADASGWRLSTTAGAAAVMRLLEVAQREELADVLDWAKLPAVVKSALGLAPDVVAWLENRVRAHAMVRGLSSCAFRLRQGNMQSAQDATLRDTALAWIEQVRQIVRGLSQTAQIAQHAQNLTQSMSSVLIELRRDAAGAQIVAVIDALTLESAPQKVNFTTFCTVLSERLEETFFVALQEHAQVVLLPLNAAAWRSADHVLVLGAQPGLWPLPAPPQAVLSYAQQASLGLARHDDGDDALHTLLARSVPITCIYTRAHMQSSFDASPWLEQLRVACQRTQIALNWRSWQPHIAQTPARPMVMPAPRTPHVPARLSASAVQALLLCPYQFFVTRLLGLAQLELIDDTPDRQDFGILAHDWVKALHDKGVFALQPEAAALTVAVEELKRRVQQHAGAREHATQYAAFAALLTRIAPSLVRWARSSVDEQTRVAAEVVIERAWQQESHQVVLHGRLDRVEEHQASGMQRVIDFKTAGKNSLDQRVRDPWHFPQLLIYGWLTHAELAQHPHRAGYVSLAGDEVTESVSREDFAGQVEQLAQGLNQAIAGLFARQPLPAHGDAATCAICAAAGVCRKGQWS
jgi:ATP-dependent helicase/nuclease subunit B